jgi:hypothetical protein
VLVDFNETPAPLAVAALLIVTLFVEVSIAVTFAPVGIPTPEMSDPTFKALKPDPVTVNSVEPDVVVTDKVGPVIGVKMNFRKLEATPIKSRFPDNTDVVTLPSTLVTFVLSSMS